MLEKRSVERLDLDLKAFVSAADNGSEPGAVNGRIRDVSTNGAYLLMDNPMSVGTKVNIDIILSLDELKKLGGKALIKTSGEVLRVESDGMAVAFDSSYRISPFSSRSNPES